MNKLLAFTIGSGAVGALLVLFGRKDPMSKYEPKTPPPSRPRDMSYGEQQRITVTIPAGWRRVTGEEVANLPELARTAVTLRNTPGFSTMTYGTLVPFLATDGNRYATFVEQHYHPPGGPQKPWGLHHGVTILAEVRTGPVMA